MIVRLSMFERIVAYGVGMERQNGARSRPDANGFKGNGAAIHMIGAAGELAAAKALGVPWVPTCNAGKAADIAPDWQVRTRWNGNYELYVRPNDGQYDRFILVLAHDYPIMNVMGWCYGHEAQHPEWWHEHGGRPGAWFIPNNELRRINDV